MAVGLRMNAERVRRNRGWLALGASPLVLAFLVLGAAARTGVWAVAFPAIHASILAAIGFLWAYRSNRSPRRTPGELVVDADGIHHEGRLLARNAELASGFVVPKADGTYVRIERRGLAPSILLGVDSSERGREVLRALGFDATQSIGVFRAASQLLAWPVAKQIAVMAPPIFVLLGGARLLLPLLGPKAFPIMMLPFVALMMVISLAKTRVLIGADGVATKWLGRERFVPFARLSGARAYERTIGAKTYEGVLLALDDGTEVKIPAGQKGWLAFDPAEMLERIEEARTLAPAATGALDPRLLARGGLPPAAWLAMLRALGDGARADLRTRAVAVDELFHLALDATAPATARGAAAVAAMPHLASDARRRIRAAAETTASPALRVALDRATEEEPDDTAIAEALAELEADEARQHARG